MDCNAIQHLDHRMVEGVSIGTVVRQHQAIGTHNLVVGKPEGRVVRASVSEIYSALIQWSLFNPEWWDALIREISTRG